MTSLIEEEEEAFFAAAKTGTAQEIGASGEKLFAHFKKITLLADGPYGYENRMVKAMERFWDIVIDPSRGRVPIEAGAALLGAYLSDLPRLLGSVGLPSSESLSVERDMEPMLRAFASRTQSLKLWMRVLGRGISVAIVRGGEVKEDVDGGQRKFSENLVENLSLHFHSLTTAAGFDLFTKKIKSSWPKTQPHTLEYFEDEFEKGFKNELEHFMLTEDVDDPFTGYIEVPLWVVDEQIWYDAVESSLEGNLAFLKSVVNHVVMPLGLEFQEAYTRFDMPLGHTSDALLEIAILHPAKVPNAALLRYTIDEYIPMLPATVKGVRTRQGAVEHTFTRIKTRISSKETKESQFALAGQLEAIMYALARHFLKELVATPHWLELLVDVCIRIEKVLALKEGRPVEETHRPFRTFRVLLEKVDTTDLLPQVASMVANNIFRISLKPTQTPEFTSRLREFAEQAIMTLLQRAANFVDKDAIGSEWISVMQMFFWVGHPALATAVAEENVEKTVQIASDLDALDRYGAAGLFQHFPGRKVHPGHTAWSNLERLVFRPKGLYARKTAAEARNTASELEKVHRRSPPPTPTREEKEDEFGSLDPSDDSPPSGKQRAQTRSRTAFRDSEPRTNASPRTSSTPTPQWKERIYSAWLGK